MILATSNRAPTVRAIEIQDACRLEARLLCACAGSVRGLPVLAPLAGLPRCAVCLSLMATGYGLYCPECARVDSLISRLMEEGWEGLD